jgi:hypothetical protein
VPAQLANRLSLLPNFVHSPAPGGVVNAAGSGRDGDIHYFDFRQAVLGARPAPDFSVGGNAAEKRKENPEIESQDFLLFFERFSSRVERAIKKHPSSVATFRNREKNRKYLQLPSLQS